MNTDQNRKQVPDDHCLTGEPDARQVEVAEFGT